MQQFEGTVIRGEGKGADKLGCPTANLSWESIGDVRLEKGVYASRIRHGAEWYRGVLVVGAPSKQAGLRGKLEAHLLDFQGGLNGKTLEIRMDKKIRPMQVFADFEQLKAQIQQDLEAVREYYRKTAPG